MDPYTYEVIARQRTEELKHQAEGTKIATAPLLAGLIGLAEKVARATWSRLPAMKRERELAPIKYLFEATDSEDDVA
jgi:hypothetical protein